MTNEKVMASVAFKTRSGMSLFDDFDKFSFNKLDDFRPKSNSQENLIDILKQEGFEIESQTDVGVSFSGPRELFETSFRTKVDKREATFQAPGRARQKILFNEAINHNLLNDKVSPYAEAIKLAIPGIPFHDSTHPTPTPPYYFIETINDVPRLLNADTVHAAGYTGNGVRISMVDTGIITRVRENHTSTDSTHVDTDHTVRHVYGVWLSSDPTHLGTNYFTGGSFSDNIITLGSELPSGSTSVEIVYSCLHPHYLSNSYTFDDIRAVGGLDVNRDEYGHGTAEAANILGVAPGATLSFVKYSNGAWLNFPLAGFQAAVQHQTPDIITCSWGTGSYDNLLHLEIVSAVSNGITVIFSAGNGHTDNPGSWYPKVVSTPDLISVGGAYPIDGGGFRASNYSSSFDSFMFTNPQRHCPDVVGLVGETPRGVLIMLPTEPGNSMDVDLSSSAFPSGDNTGSNDGWCACSGTSASAPQTAGVAALLLEKYPNLTPNAIKNILQNSAFDIQTGSTNSAGPDTAADGWDAATGFGLVDADAAVNYLNATQFNCYIRDSILDNGTEPVTASRLYTSPDIIVRNEPVLNPQDELGMTVKYRHDLSDEAEDGQDNYVYLRIQNRGTVTGDCTATVYFTDPGMFANPASWTNIGQVTVEDLEPGEFKVVGPIVWSDADITSTGHFCLISILDSASDPAPDLTTITSDTDFVNMVRNKNNVAWKNIRINDIIPGGSSNHSFYIEGPSGSGHQADLHIDVSSLPAGSSIMVKTVKRLIDSASLSNLSITNESSLYSTLNHLGGTAIIDDMNIKSNEKSKVTVYYSVPEGTPDGDYPIVSTLYIDGANVGRYTTVVRVSHFAFIGNRNSRELHRKGCSWIDRMSAYNKIPFGDIDRGHKQGFDNCAFCIGDSKR